MQGSGDRAAVTVLSAVVLALATLAVLAAATLGGVSLQAERAQAVADVAALAGAVGGQGAAEAVVLANDANVESFDRIGATVVIEVVHGRAAAVAAARPEPGWSHQRAGAAVGSHG